MCECMSICAPAAFTHMRLYEKSRALSHDNDTIKNKQNKKTKQKSKCLLYTNFAIFQPVPPSSSSSFFTQARAFPHMAHANITASFSSQCRYVHALHDQPSIWGWRATLSKL